jgi:PAS domain S-box-containing protein
MKTGFSDHRIAKIAKLGKKLNAEIDFNNKLIAAINTSIEGIALLDELGFYIYMNRAHEKMFGYDEGEMIGQSWTMLYSEKDVENFVTTVFPEIEKNGYWKGEATAICKDGKTKVEEYLTLTATEDGWLICTCRERKDEH